MKLHINATSFLKNKLWLINVLFDRQIFRLILVFAIPLRAEKQKRLSRVSAVSNKNMSLCFSYDVWRFVSSLISKCGRHNINSKLNF